MGTPSPIISSVPPMDPEEAPLSIPGVPPVTPRGFFPIRLCVAQTEAPRQERAGLPKPVRRIAELLCRPTPAHVRELQARDPNKSLVTAGKRAPKESPAEYCGAFQQPVRRGS